MKVELISETFLEFEDKTDAFLGDKATNHLKKKLFPFYSFCVNTFAAMVYSKLLKKTSTSQDCLLTH